MKVALISFTGQGAKTCRKIEAALTSAGYECSAFGKDTFAGEAGILPLKNSLSEWTASAFRENEALVFVGACGIAVRAIAPHIKDKTVDPAVIVVDEKGKSAISLLSGHLGGANELACEIAELIGAEPVITTATDLNGKFAVDEWARKNHLLMGDMKLAKEISAAILKGEQIGVSSDYPIGGKLPEQLWYVPENGNLTAGTDAVPTVDDLEQLPEHNQMPKIGIRISLYEEDGPFEKTLHLMPRTLTVGIGCRKGIEIEAAEELLNKTLKENRLSVRSIERLCTIDIKKEEAALMQLADKLGVPLQVFSAAELEQASGEFTASNFVNQITGVDNVCERAAVMGGRGELIVRKQALNGATIAIAVRAEKFRFS